MKKRHLIVFLKILFICASFAFIFWKVDTSQIWEYVKNTNPLFLLSCYFLMSAAQVLSAYRMRYYYEREGLYLNSKFSIGLYFTAMFFNTVLPGGIGGDAYKIYTIGKFAGFSHLRALKISVSERASGLFALLILTAVFYAFTSLPQIIPYQSYIIAACTIITIPAYFIATNILLKEKANTAIGASIYSFPVQLLNAAIALILLLNFQPGAEFQEIIAYLVIFMVSSIAAILPLTIGGVGLREITFLYGANLAGLNAELGISIAILFFLVNLATSLNGLFFWHRLEKLYKSPH